MEKGSSLKGEKRSRDWGSRREVFLVRSVEDVGEEFIGEVRDVVALFERRANQTRGIQPERQSGRGRTVGDSVMLEVFVSNPERTKRGEDTRIEGGEKREREQRPKEFEGTRMSIFATRNQSRAKPSTLSQSHAKHAVLRSSTLKDARARLESLKLRVTRALGKGTMKGKFATDRVQSSTNFLSPHAQLQR